LNASNLSKIQEVYKSLGKVRRKRKSPENQWFSGLDGGDKRDRTADLLNAMSAIREQDEF